MQRLSISALLLFGLTMGPFAPYVEARPATVGEIVETALATPHPYASSGAETSVLTWREEVSFPGATYIALRFARFELAAGDYVVVRAPDDAQRWTYRELGKGELGRRGGFFAGHVKGDRAIVELYTRGMEAAYGLAIDGFGRGFSAAEIERFWDEGLGERMGLPYPASLSRSLCTADDTLDARCYELSEPTVYDRSRAVARLLVGGIEFCTGWLLGCDGHVMTNEHCVSSQSLASNTDFEFMAEGATCATSCDLPGACPGTVEADEALLVAVDAALDYALLLPDTSTGSNTDLAATYGFLQLRASGPELDERIYIPQHPAGWGKRVALASTYPGEAGGVAHLVSLSEPACTGGSNDVGYWADTRGGSSGAPVLGYGDHQVVALHHCGGDAACTAGDPGMDDPNRGTASDELILSLDTDLPNCAVCTPPAAPTSILASASGPSSIDLSWSHVGGAGITYSVYRSQGVCPGGVATRIASGLSTMSFTDNSAAADTAWSYTVTAVDGASCESAASACGEVPSFTLAASPPSVGVCQPADGTFTVNVGAIGGFGAAVSLSAMGVPAGATVSFAPPSVSPPGVSTLTISNTGAAAAGTYALTLSGSGGTPTLTRTAGVSLSIAAGLASAPGLVTPTDGAVDVSSTPQLTWNAVAAADTYEVMWSTDETFTSFASAIIADPSFTPASPLDLDTRYYWRVRAINACGTGSPSATFTFITAPLSILLVDDDNNAPDVRAFYTDALDALGLPYDVWDTGGGDAAEPGGADLAPYRTVIWFSGDNFTFGFGTGTAGPGPAAETALAGFLDNGRCLFVSSQDYYYDHTLTTFMADYLGVASVDGEVFHTTVTGSGILAGAGPFSLAFPPGLANLTDDLTGDGTAAVAFTGDQGTAALSKASGGYATSFWGFGFETLPTVADRQTVLSTLLDWCASTVVPREIFADGFESGNTSRWSSEVP